MARSDLNSFQAQTKCSEIGWDLFLIEKNMRTKLRRTKWILLVRIGY